MNNDQGPREFLRSRHTCKTGEELLKAAGQIPDEFLPIEKQQYSQIQERDTVSIYEKIIWKGELFNVHPEPTSNPIYFNQQVDDRDLSALRDKCTAKQFVEAVKLLPEYNFSAEETLKQVKVKSRPSPCFECGVAGCFRRQQRWQGRVLHGCYPNEPLIEFQHDKSNLVPSCYHLQNNQNDLISDKFQEALNDFREIDRQSG